MFTSKLRTFTSGIRFYTFDVVEQTAKIFNLNEPLPLFQTSNQKHVRKTEDFQIRSVRIISGFSTHSCTTWSSSVAEGLRPEYQGYVSHLHKLFTKWGWQMKTGRDKSVRGWMHTYKWQTMPSIGWLQGRCSRFLHELKHNDSRRKMTFLFQWSSSVFGRNNSKGHSLSRRCSLYVFCPHRQLLLSNKVIRVYCSHLWAVNT